MSTKQEQIQGGETNSAENPSLQELLGEYKSVQEQVETTREEVNPAVEAERAKITEAQQRIEEITHPLTALEDRQKELRMQMAYTALTEVDTPGELSVDATTAWLLRTPNNSPEVVQRWAEKINNLNEQLAADSPPFIYLSPQTTEIGLLEGLVEPDRSRFSDDFKAPASHITTQGFAEGAKNVINDPESSRELGLRLNSILNCKVSTKDIEETRELFHLDRCLIIGEEAVRKYFENVADYYTEHPAFSSGEDKVFNLWLALKNTGVDCTDLLPEGQSLGKFKQITRDRFAYYIENWISPYGEGILSSNLVQMIKLTGVTAAEARDDFESIASADDDLSDRDIAKLRELFEIDLKYEFELTDEAE